MTSKRALNINASQYKHLLEKPLKHNCYFDSFNSARQAQQNFLDAEPTINDFITEVVTLNISLPFPITEPGVIVKNVDKSNTLVLQKQQYNQKLQSFLRRYEKDKKWLTKKYVKDTKYGMLPKYIFDLSVGNIKDPDVYFNGDYNWYYAGGILDIFSHCEEEYLIYTDDNNLLHTTSDLGRSYTTEVNILNKAPIYEITAAHDDHSIVSLRQKHKVCTLEMKLKRNGEFAFNVIHSEASDLVPYIDIKYYDNEICTLKLNNELQIYDIHNPIGDTYTFETTMTTDCFGQIDYLTKHTVIHLSRNSLKTLDKRSKELQTYVIEDKFFKCDELCTFSSCGNPDYIFISSVHNIFKFDLRRLSIVKTWSHMLSSPPVMMKVRRYDNDELLFLSSLNYKDRVVLLSNDSESNLVQIVPNNMKTWNECNRSYHFNLYNENVERLKFCPLGIAMLNNGNDIDLYTCNSVGDVFKNHVSREDNESMEPSEKLNRWFNSFPRKTKPLSVSHFRELTHVKDALENPIDTSALTRYTKENRKRLDLLSDMTLEDVDMAEIWLAEENPQQEIPFPSTSAQTKVSEWLQQGEDNISDHEDYL